MAAAPVLTRRYAEEHDQCQRCRAPGIRLIGLRRTGSPAGWTRVVLCPDCEILAEADPRYAVLRLVD
jgi:hypothetical protein